MMRERLQSIDRDALRPFVVPVALGGALTLAAGLLGGGWRTGAFLGGSVGGFVGALEYLNVNRRALLRKRGGR